MAESKLANDNQVKFVKYGVLFIIACVIYVADTKDFLEIQL